MWFIGYWTHGRFLQDTDDATIDADQQAVTNRVAGYVDEIYVADNQVVHRGDPLVRIDDGHPRAQIDQALGQVEQGRASIQQAEAQIVQQRATIAQNQAQLAGSVVQAAFYTREADRYAPLAASGAETREKYDQMRQNRDQALATVAQNRAAVAAARRQILVLRAQAAQGLAQVHQAQAQVRANRVDVDATLIRANLDGRIGSKTATVGQYIAAGTRLMTVVPVEGLYVVANFKETQLGIMRVGQPVTIEVDALKNNTLHGWVESFSPGTGAQFALMPPNNATGNFTKIVQRVPTRIRLDAGPEVRRVLVPGMSVTVTVDTIGARDDTDRFKAEEKRDKPAAKRDTEQRNRQLRDIERSEQ